jgi:hypothetical protein
MSGHRAVDPKDHGKEKSREHSKDWSPGKKQEQEYDDPNSDDCSFEEFHIRRTSPLIKGRFS